MSLDGFNYKKYQGILMTNHHFQIMWQKWSDPFGSDDIDLLNDSMDSMYYNDEAEEEPDDDSNNTIEMNQNKKIRVIATPMGILPLTENTSIGQIFNFWVGHTNFDITKKIASIIENTDGVETLDVYTRYRFRVGIGKAFIDSDIMRNINDNVYMELENHGD